MAVVKNMVTPKWLALVSGNMDQNLRSNSWWFYFDPHGEKLEQDVIDIEPL